MVANGRPDITETGATVKEQNGAGYAPPDGPGGPIRTGHFASSGVCDPYANQEDD